MAFGKPGRPREDRLARQQEIFGLVRPLITREVRQLTMAGAARAAHLSVGGLYHYFPSKRALVLLGIDPVNLERVCADFRPDHEALARTDPPALLAASLDTLAWAALHYIRPSALAAIELDAGAFRASLDEVLTTELIGLVQTVQLAHPALTAKQAHDLNRALRLICTLAFVDASITAAQLRAQLQAAVVGTLHGYATAT
jgi:AcrR family transcriptional regulator